MEISNNVAIAGIIFSLAIFGLLLLQAVLAQRLNQLGDEGETSPEKSIITAAPPPTKTNRPGLNKSVNRSEIKLLAISKDRGSQEQLKDLAELYGWDLFLCGNCQRAESILKIESFPIVLCDSEALDISWREVFQMIRRSDPSRCLILCSRTDDDCLWHEVVRRGGYDVIDKPLREEQVVRTVKFAWAFWKTMRCRSTSPV